MLTDRQAHSRGNPLAVCYNGFVPVLSDSPTARLVAARGNPEDGSPEERAVRWILRLPDCTFFRLDSCPHAPPDAVATAVSELMERPYPAITRYVAGVYRREPSAYSPMYGRWHDLCHAAARIVAPPVGSGLGSYSALLTLGLANQVPTSTLVAVTDPDASPPADLPPGSRHKYQYRSNERRNELTWHEVTLLEAIREGALWETFWPLKWPVALKRHRESITSLDRHLAVGDNPLIRRDRLQWAAEAEETALHHYDDDDAIGERLNKERADLFAERLHWVLSVLPAVLDEPKLQAIQKRRIRRNTPGRCSETVERLRWRFGI